jgi:glycosyltransferase involved in cell wall biosynthesis
LKGVQYIDQFTAGFASGDAISSEALILQDFLRRLGYESNIYSQHFQEQDGSLVRHFRGYHRKKNAILIYHHSFYSDFLLDIDRYPARKILIHHNTTPPEFVERYNRQIATQLRATRTRLRSLAHNFEIALADSNFNANDLREMGFPNVDVMPVALDFNSWEDLPDAAHLDFLNDGRKNILFVGRVFPNKKHQDLIKTYYFLKQIVPESRLIMVGTFHPGVRGYTAELFNLTRELGLENDVLFTGMVSQSEIQTYYRKADVFLSMSEHEGFFVPLVECMYFGVPVLAHASSVIPETLGDCGILFGEKDYPRIAEMIARILDEPEFKRAIVTQQRNRLPDFELSRTLTAFSRALEQMGIIHP